MTYERLLVIEPGITCVTNGCRVHLLSWIIMENQAFFQDFCPRGVLECVPTIHVMTHIQMLFKLLKVQRLHRAKGTSVAPKVFVVILPSVLMVQGDLNPCVMDAV